MAINMKNTLILIIVSVSKTKHPLEHAEAATVRNSSVISRGNSAEGKAVKLTQMINF